MPNSELGRPFGYLKPASTGDMVNLLVLPYDYPALSVLLHQLVKVHRQKPPLSWVNAFRKYLANIPPYYYPNLRLTMRKTFGPLVGSDDL